MIYKFLVDFIIILHFLWILFIIFGFVFAFFGSKIVLLHLAGLFFALVMNLLGWYCPLTYLENYLYALHDINSAYSGSFVRNYLEPLIYPNLPERYIRTGEIVFVCLYIIFYVYLAKKHHVLDRLKTR